jgi:CheY-like chemotaxis protein
VPLPGEEMDAMEKKSPLPRILIIDDDPLVVRVVGRGLADRYDVEVTTDSRNALERFAAGERFAAVLCDLTMPELTGMDLHREVAKTDAEQAKRFIFMTGGAFTARARAFLDSNDNERIDKPIDRRALDELLARMAPTV